MTNFVIRRMEPPYDFTEIAPLLNMIWSEPTTAEQLKTDEESIPPGKLHYNADGELEGWDRPKWVAEDAHGHVLAYAIAWRAPWTEPGALICNLIVDPKHRGKGVGNAIHAALLAWATEVKASRLISFLRETDEMSLDFAARRGCVKERHTFESVLELDTFDGGQLFDTIAQVERNGIHFVTLAEEPGEESERQLHELYRVTHQDIPGFSEGYPWFEEWKKWNIDRPGARPAWIHIAKDGDRYVGVVTLQQNEQTQAMYHDYTGVLPEYRGRRIALALKLLGIQTAKRHGVPYLRTHNDSLNGPMLHINRQLLGFRAEPGQYKMVLELPKYAAFS
ncbi:GNAT family N-acetyltransferase [Paenibacillus oryzisoli]|uniref:GNAT family N-acetyltransferase n=1 Tax=Paenibacillus oryzisoli TaxID=1850517 RepID=UPI003D2BB1D4